MFQVCVSEVWLKNEVSDAAYFPENDGTFNLSDVTEYTTLAVEGPD